MVQVCFCCSSEGGGERLGIYFGMGSNCAGCDIYLVCGMGGGCGECSNWGGRESF